ncbi:mucin-6 [Orycteropus afer afer]|uniref:Mucin-6 n=1 Tax=Orycteropus afer afer TaxID=1230840 RepID=A0AC54ZDK1_ORYAF|nr:mucin-6 [Orycteropus afer afer]
MLGLQLLLLLSYWGALLAAGLSDTSFADPGLRRLKDPSLTAEDKGWCSTWGAGHFSTFDHHLYDFLGTCNYIFAAICKGATTTFSVQLRRGPDGKTARIIVEMGSSVVTVQNGVVSIKDVGLVSLPYTSNGLQITPFGQNTRLVAKQLELELEVLWGPDGHLMVLVERKNMGKMCGLCGNFDGEKTNEFLNEDGKLLEPHKYAALQKLDDPNEICAYEAIPRPRAPQREHARTCAQLLSLVSPACNVSREPFVQSCEADTAACAQPGQRNCSCATLSEFSRQCSMAGQAVSSWRKPGLCSVGQCPANQVYKECGTASVRTCSNPRHSSPGFCTFGCFCPKGTVLDDLSKNQTCVPVTRCPCILNGVVYAPGEVTSSACRTCRCTEGLWKCTERPCPGRCSLEGGSFVTTFDARPYRFHGTCTYILLQSRQLPDGGSLMAVYDKSGYSHSETSLVAIIYLSGQDKVVISQDEVITNNGDVKWLPYITRNFTIFRQTSTHLQMATQFGLELLVQLRPVFQAYVTVGPQFRGQTRGLCGNYNGDTTDDLTTSMGIAEGTASLFVDSWRAGNCPAALERETDPCSMSQLNKVCAESHCSVLVKKGSVFEKCHSVVNPNPFYKRCVYQACNYEETFPHICAALGSYAHLCASHGVLLEGWRDSVDNCTVPCTGNRTFSYDSQACDRTCLSLSDRSLECHPSTVPVDGCNCPEGTYLNHKAECVRRAQCPCQLDSHKFILAGQSTVVDGATCYCINGRLTCPGKPQMLLATCTAPKTFQSCSQSSESKFGAACAPTCQMLATGTACVPTKCEPGCVCAEGLYEDANGQCVPPDDCPCEFAGTSYPRGAELSTDCQTCICERGKWVCEQSAHCTATCSLYGEGHVITFDGQRFVFDGNCEYTLTTDGCGANSSRPTFKVVTENVICGKSGVTCSRAIKLFLGALSIVLADRTYTVSGDDPQVSFQVRPGSLNLVLDIHIAGKYNLTLTWNKHMTVFVSVSRASPQDAFCGLCGNYNGNMKDDFETRSKYVASSELEFVNSWKESPLCGDVSFVQDPCSLNSFRRSWAERKCSIINSQTFAACHSQVYRIPYYEACVRDTCGCDTGGDCECLCDAVAAYAKACLDKGVCVDWRAPDFCPVYCDFFNSHTSVSGSSEYQYTQEASCTWHYQPCLCPNHLQSYPHVNIEGCYNCSQNEYFDPATNACVPCALPTTPSPPITGDCKRARTTSKHYSHHPEGHISSKTHIYGAHSDPCHKPANVSPHHGHTDHSSGHSAHHTTYSNYSDVGRDLGDTASFYLLIFTQHGSPLRNIVQDHLFNTNKPRDHTIHLGATIFNLLVSTSSSSHSTGPPSGTSLKTTFPKPTHPETTLSTQVPPFSTSSVTPTSHIVVTPTNEVTTPSTSTPRPSGPLPTTATPHTGPTHSSPPPTKTTSSTGTPQTSISTRKTTSSLVSRSPSTAPPITITHSQTTITPKPTTSGTGTPVAHTTTSATQSQPHTPFTTLSAPTVSTSSSSHSTGPPSGTSFKTTYPTATHPETTLSTRVPPFSTSSVTPTSHRVVTPTKEVTRPSTLTPSIYHLSFIQHRSPIRNILQDHISNTNTPQDHIIHSDATILNFLGVCSVREYEEEVTYKGCTANVTMTRCEGTCTSSASFNIDTKQVDVHCSCCHPLGSYEKQLMLPCSDPQAPGGQLVLTLLVFSGCECSRQACGG